jgi:hypothetical protein
MGVHVNKPATNIIGWSAIVVLICLTIALLILPFFSK